MRTLLIIFLLWIGTSQTLLFAQTEPISSALAISEHPRILLPQAEVQALQQAIQADTHLRRVHHLILTQCDSLLQIKRSAMHAWRPERIQHKQVRETLRRLFALAYGWRLTNRQDYFARAKYELWQVLMLAQWNAERVENLAEITMATSIAYDWLYANLSPGDRSFVQRTILEKGLEAALAPRKSSWAVPSDNQKQVLNAGLTGLWPSTRPSRCWLGRS
jgi:hypothetical protein